MSPLEDLIQRVEPRKREKRQWWYVNDAGRPAQVTGYDCQPQEPPYWWCPSIGYSMPESKLYESEDVARSMAIQQAKDECFRLKALIESLSDGRNTDG